MMWLSPSTVAMSARLLVLFAVTASLGFVAVGQTVPESVSEYSCSAANYTDGSPYAKNVNDLVTVLPMVATKNGYGWFSSGSAGGAPDEVSALVMCYADSTVAQCLDCLWNVSAGELRGVCPNSRAMSVIYGECVLRYADEPILGTADKSTMVGDWRNAPGGADVASLNATRWRLLTALVEGAAAAGQTLRFANGSAAYTDARGEAQVMYGLAQCTRDLLPSECAGCLTDQLARGVAGNMDNSTQGTVRGYSCYLRFQLNEPIDIIAGLQLAAPPAPAPSPQPSGRRRRLAGRGGARRW